MKLRFALVAALALGCAAALVGCSGNDGKIEVESASAALTNQGNDSLFTIKLVEARDDGYAFEGVHVKVTPDEKDTVDLSCTINDFNTNKKLDKGDTVTCTEPSENKFGTDLAGKEIEVELYAKIDGEDERIGDGAYDAK